MNSAHENNQKLREAILARAASDPEFRSGLLTRPKDAIREGFGVTMPEEFKIQFIEKAAGLDALVVLPDPVNADGDLSDRDLDTVHGGAGLTGHPNAVW